MLPTSRHPSCRLCLPEIRNVKVPYFKGCNGATILKSIEAQCLIYISAVVSFINCISQLTSIMYFLQELYLVGFVTKASVFSVR